MPADPMPVTRHDADELLELTYDVQARLATRLDEVLTARRDAGQPVSEQDERALAARELEPVLAEALRARSSSGRRFLTAEEEFSVKQSVVAAVFGLGRLEELLADPEVENVDIVGCDPVALSYADGSVRLVGPVAPTDEALVRLLQRIAARHSRIEKAINAANPLLNTELPDGSRLAATIEVCARPQVSIRRHRLQRIGLDELVRRGMLSRAQLALLRAAMRAEKNIVVCGRQKAGKTTLLRALCWEIPRTERFATVETEYELGLHRVADRFPLVLPLEERPGSTERMEHGRPAGGIGLARLVWQALRMHTSRIIVGEVRGEEIVPMLDAMSTGGASSLSTLHARGASQAVERMVSLCLAAGWPEPFANRVIAESIDLIVHVRLTSTAGGLDRFVDEIVAIEQGEQGRAARTPLFSPIPGGALAGRGVPTGLLPTDIADYELVRFDRGWLTRGDDGDWGLPTSAFAVDGVSA